MSKQSAFKKYSIFGVEIDSPKPSEAIDYIVKYASGTKNAACYITKPYVEFLDVAYQNSDIVELLNNSELCLPDGVALCWATTYLYGGKHSLPRLLSTLAAITTNSKATYQFLPDKYAGTNFSWPLLEACAQNGLRVFLVGTPKERSIKDTAQVITERLPDIQVVGTMPGYITSGYTKELAAQITKTKADIVLVGLGFPLQEKIMSEVIRNIKHGVLIGEGGTFDFESFGGKYKKAPGVFQRAGLEWLWRLMLEPSRLKRQLAIPRFIWRVYRFGRS